MIVPSPWTQDKALTKHVTFSPHPPDTACELYTHIVYALYNYTVYIHCITMYIHCNTLYTLRFCTDFKEESFNESCNGKMVDGTYVELL